MVLLHARRAGTVAGGVYPNLNWRPVSSLGARSSPTRFRYPRITRHINLFLRHCISHTNLVDIGGLRSLIMARALNKIQKQISKKRGGKPTALHENSRDAQRLRRAGAREEKLRRSMEAALKANQVYGKTGQVASDEIHH